MQADPFAVYLISWLAGAGLLIAACSIAYGIHKRIEKAKLAERRAREEQQRQEDRRLARSLNLSGSGKARPATAEQAMYLQLLHDTPTARAGRSSSSHVNPNSLGHSDALTTYAMLGMAHAAHSPAAGSDSSSDCSSSFSGGWDSGGSCGCDSSSSSGGGGCD